jgi:hypothetical protein
VVRVSSEETIALTLLSRRGRALGWVGRVATVHHATQRVCTAQHRNTGQLISTQAYHTTQVGALSQIARAETIPMTIVQPVPPPAPVQTSGVRQLIAALQKFAAMASPFSRVSNREGSIRRGAGARTYLCSQQR